MAIALSTSAATRGPSRARGGLSGLIEGFLDWRARRRAAAELHALDDRMLDDIGVSRGDIERVVRDGVRR